MNTLSPPKETKARKEHRCDFCTWKITTNELYIKSTYAYDGSVYDWKTHKYCSKLADDLKIYDYCDYEEGVSTDDFMEVVNEKYYRILTKGMTTEERVKYSDIIRQIRYVEFREKLWFVIRHLKKIEL